MRKSIRMISILLALLLLCGCGKKAEAPTTQAAPTQPVDAVVAVVNGEEIRTADYEYYRQQYLASSAAMGVDIAASENLAYLEDAALSACIRDTLVAQDMRAQGCYDFSEEVEKWVQEMGTAAYENALLDVQEYLRSTLGEAKDTDMTKAALAYAEGLGVTAEDYINVYRDQYASANYDAWLTRDVPVTDKDVEDAYAANVEEAKNMFVGDIAGYEAAIASGEAVWYQPSGYRSILQILLPAAGETDEEKLASVREVLDDIYARLDRGEKFETLIAEYGQDSNLKDSAFLSVGYSVHRNSVLWEDSFIAAAFSEDMKEPGDWTHTPLVSGSGVHILYYLKDAESGAVPMTDTIREALSYTIFQSRVEERMSARIEELSAAAEVKFPE